MAISYMLPENIMKKSTTCNQIPAGYDHIKVSFPDSKVSVAQGSWGIMIHITGCIAGYHYDDLYFKPVKDLELKIETSEQMISHLAVHSGNTTVSGHGKTMYLEAGLQALHYLPEKAYYTAAFPAQTAYHAITFSYDRSLIKELETSFPKLKEICEQFNKSGSKKHLSLPSVRLGMNSRLVINQMKNTRYEGAARNVFYRARISDYLLTYLQQAHRRPGTEVEILHARYPEITKLIADINRAPEQSFILTQKAEELGLSLRMLQKAFKYLTGTTAKNYVMLQRLTKAKSLLKNTSLTVAEISVQLGFTEPTHFNKVFKERTGMTPMQFRST